MSHGDGPPPIFEGDDFPYWKIRMLEFLEPPLKVSQNLRIPHTFKAMKLIMKNGMQKL